MSDPHCVCCGTAPVVPYLDLGSQPLANGYRAANETTPEVRYPLVVAYCPVCFHSQLTEAVDPAAMFGHYLYVSGTTQTFRAHCAALARDAMSRSPAYRRDSKARVLDVACNDGTLLESFRSAGCDVMGVDPAENLRALTAAKGIPADVAYFGREWARAHRRPYDLITATNVLAHVAEPAGFLQAAETLLAARGAILVEFPYGRTTLERCEFDQVYHEHRSYFTARSFEELVSRHTRLSVRAVIETPIHGGSVRFILQRHADATTAHCPRLRELIGEERARALYDPATYAGYQSRVDAVCQQLRDTLQQYGGHIVVGYGASAKGNTLGNYAGIAPSLIVDDNPLKHGHVTPGRHVPIAAPDALSGISGSVAFLMTAWNFRDEIIRRIHAARGTRRGDVAITYVPRVEVMPL